MNDYMMIEPKVWVHVLAKHDVAFGEFIKLDNNGLYGRALHTCAAGNFVEVLLYERKTKDD